LRNDCDNPGTKLATATPAANATMESVTRPIIPRLASTRPHNRGRYDGADWGFP